MNHLSVLLLILFILAVPVAFAAVHNGDILPRARLGGFVTVLDLKKIEEGAGYNVVEENVANHPELRVLPADTLTGTDMRLTVRTDLPTVAFSTINKGVSGSKSGYDTRLFQTAFLDALIPIDVRLLQQRTAAAAGRYMQNEQSGFVESAVRHTCKQFYYGVANDALGFVGLIAQMGTTANHTVDATGAAAKSSVFFFAAGPEKVEWLFGNGRTISFDAWYRQTVKDADQKDMEAMLSWMHFAPGMRLANRNAVVRIKNIGTAANKTLTYGHMYEAYRKMTDELKMMPTHIFMTGRSREQLRQERVTPENPAPPLPTEFEGIPILQTHSISNDESI